MIEPSGWLFPATNYIVNTGMTQEEEEQFIENSWIEDNGAQPNIIFKDKPNDGI